MISSISRVRLLNHLDKIGSLASRGVRCVRAEQGECETQTYFAFRFWYQFLSGYLLCALSFFVKL